MAISVSARKLLWGRSGSRCAFPSCRTQLAHTSDLTGASVVLGEEAHIVSRSADGPRGRDPVIGDRDGYDNLVLMCPTHHTLIDSAAGEYPTARLHQVKAEHEAWVQGALGLDRGRLAAEVRVAQVVDHVDAQLGLGEWDWTIGTLIYGVEPELPVSLINQLRDLCRWIQVRPWPSGFDPVRDALEGLSLVLSALLDHFEAEAELLDSEEERKQLVYPRWYKIKSWDPELYHRLLAEYQDARGLMDDLVYEATRHLNWFMDAVRASVDHEYREREGYVYLTGDDMGNGRHVLVPRFTSEELAAGRPYKGTPEFLSVRGSRVHHS